MTRRPRRGRRSSARAGAICGKMEDPALTSGPARVFTWLFFKP